jgi:hypothetical protein
MESKPALRPLSQSLPSPDGFKVHSPGNSFLPTLTEATNGSVLAVATAGLATTVSDFFAGSSLPVNGSKASCSTISKALTQR